MMMMMMMMMVDAYQVSPRITTILSELCMAPKGPRNMVGFSAAFLEGGPWGCGPICVSGKMWKSVQPYLMIYMLT